LSSEAVHANIKLTAEGDEATRMTLTAVYRPPLGALGAGLDRVLLHKVATATVHSLITNMARALEGTAPAPVRRARQCGGRTGRKRLPDTGIEVSLRLGRPLPPILPARPRASISR
jgi:hypothetical protein